MSFFNKILEHKGIVLGVLGGAALIGVFTYLSQYTEAFIKIIKVITTRLISKEMRLSLTLKNK